ncbi:MAG: glycosyltransferase [Lachnospiraceae bacterium]|nr:glycosyltransferase [Lachnospiraceae bacterium]
MKKALLIAREMKFFSDFEVNNIRLLQSLGFTVWCGGNEKTRLWDARRIDELGVKKVDLPFVTNPFAAENRRVYRELCALMEKERFDLVHCHMPVGGAFGRLSAHRTKTGPVLYTAHGFHFLSGGPKKNWIYYPIEKYLSRYTDVLITINEEDYRRALKFHAKKVIRLPGIGVDTKEFQTGTLTKPALCEKLAIPPDSILALSVGEIRPLKNHEAVIRAMQALNDPRLHFLIVGVGDYEEELKQIIVSCGLSDRVHLMGWQKDVKELLHAADFYCQTSTREGMPVALMEAMAAGKPILASDIRGNNELCEKAGGELFRLLEEGGAAGALKALLGRQDEWEAMGRFNQKKMEHYDRSVVSGIMREVYSSLI